VKNRDDNFGYLQAYAKYFSLVFQMIVLIVMGGFGGRALDNLLHFQKPVCAVVLIILAAALSLYLFFRTILKK
jgi:hypothetical protein